MHSQQLRGGIQISRHVLLRGKAGKKAPLPLQANLQKLGMILFIPTAPTQLSLGEVVRADPSLPGSFLQKEQPLESIGTSLSLLKGRRGKEKSRAWPCSALSPSPSHTGVYSTENYFKTKLFANNISYKINKLNSNSFLN